MYAEANKTLQAKPNKMPMTLIAAVSRNGCIGKAGGIPWHIPGGQLVFKQLTLSKVVLMGRKTWESIPEKYRPLSERRNVVITRQVDYPLPPNVEHFTDIASALSAHQADEICVIGGAEIYRSTIDQADKLEISRIDQEIDGDTFFPAIDANDWQLTQEKAYEGFWLNTYHRKAK